MKVKTGSLQFSTIEQRHFLQKYWRNRVPFLIRLRNCQDGLLPAPEEFPRLVASEIGTPPERWVETVLREKRGLILLDGIDEIPNVRRDEARRAMVALMRQYEGNYFVISSRPAAVDEGWFRGLDVEVARINPMSDPDREEFVRRWHAAVEVKLGDAIPVKLQTVCQSLLEKLRENPPIRRLAANPLLCGAICALHYFRNEFLPDSQRELCETLCHLLIHQREVEGGLRLDEYPEPYRTLTYDQKRSIIQDFAHYMVRNEEPTLALDRAFQLTAGALQDFPGRAASDATAVQEGLIERSGVIRKATVSSVDFIHNTLKEYLAAERFAADRDAGFLAKRAFDPSWWPVVLFAVACGDRAFDTELIHKILDPEPNDAGGGADDDAELRARHIMALQCGANAFKLAPELKQRLASIEQTIFPPRSMADAEGLAVLGDQVVRFLRHRRMNARRTAASVRALRLIGTEHAREALRGYLQDGRETVAVELAQALNPLEVEYWVKTAIDRGSPLPPAVARQVTRLDPIAERIEITKLNLGDTQVSDLAPLSKLTNLQELRLNNTQVSDLGPLSKLINLQTLSLEGTQVSDLAPLSKLTNLQTLSLEGTQVSDLAPLSKLANLQALWLDDTQVSDLGPLNELTNLKMLSFSGTWVSDLGPLKKLANLQALWLNRTQVSDLAPLSKLTNLQTLWLGWTQVSDLAPLSKLTNLQTLWLGWTQVSDLGPVAGIHGLHVEGVQSVATPLGGTELVH